MTDPNRFRTWPREDSEAERAVEDSLFQKQDRDLYGIDDNNEDDGDDE